jgi:hypothetical protein
LRRGGLIGAALLLLALGIAGAAPAEVVQDGNVIVTFNGGISPRVLPREGMAPVAVKVEGTFKSTEEVDPPPQLQTISIGINRAGKIFDKGLPVCRVREIQPATISVARKICRGAIVGSGRVQVRVHLDNQAPFTFNGPLLVFNAEPSSSGQRRLLAQVYGRKPPSAFVLNFRIYEAEGEFGTVIKTSLPKPARRWAFITHFDMKLQRKYTYKGQKRSYVNAGCAAPKGFPGAVFNFARSNFGFAGGNHVTTTLVRDCIVR